MEVLSQAQKCMSRSDPYSLLGPIDHNSEDMCGCSSWPILILREWRRPNPLTCGRCFGEVPPDWINLPHDLVYPIAQWRDLFRSLYLLWADRGEYQSWAAARLSDPSGSVNLCGRELAAKISTLCVRCFYWWFLAEMEREVSECPICKGLVAPWPGQRVRFCNACKVIL